MILALPSPPRFYCEQPACLVACLDAAHGGQPVTRAWRVPMTATCASCGCDLYGRLSVKEAQALATFLGIKETQ